MRFRKQPPPETPEQVAEGASLEDQGVEAGPSAASPGTGQRRRRLALLVVLATAAALLLAFSGWYLAFRKPISEFPLPQITTERMPGYGYSLYGTARPMGIAVNADGSRIYATQTVGEPAVLVFDSRGQTIATIRPPDSAIDHVFVYVAVEPRSGDVYVTDRPAAVIHVYSSEGEYRRTVECPPGLNAWQPLGVSFAPDGGMLVTDAGTGQVHEFAPDGSLRRTIGSVGQFNFPNAAIVDAAGTIYVSDSNNGRLILLDPNGNQIGVLRRGPYEGDLGMPRGLATDDRGRIYVVDATDQSVKVYRPVAEAAGQLTFVGRFGVHGTNDGAFRFPNAVATDARGRIYVADWNNDRVQVWSY